MFKKSSTPFVGFLQATVLVIYILLISTFMNWMSTAPNKPDSSYYGPILFLLLFIISAVISATIVLGKAAIYFWEKQYKKSFTLLGWTVGWGFFYLVFFFVMYLKR